MSILDGLRQPVTHDGSVSDNQLLFYNSALYDAREALTNPDPVMLRPIAAALHQRLDVGRFDLLQPHQQARWMEAAATVLAAAAGGDQFRCRQ